MILLFSIRPILLNYLLSIYIINFVIFIILNKQNNCLNILFSINYTIFLSIWILLLERYFGCRYKCSWWYVFQIIYDYLLRNKNIIVMIRHFIILSESFNIETAHQELILLFVIN